jgi:hypothetical protein
MTDATSTDTAPKPLNLLQRIVGVIFSPRATYQAIAARPVVLGALLVVILLGGGVTYWLMGSEAGRQMMTAMAEEQIRNAEAQGQTISPENRKTQLMVMQYIGIGGAIAQVVFTPAMIAVLAAVLMAVMNALSGIKASFRQLFAVVTHAWIIPGLTGFVTTPLMLAKQELSSPSTVGALLPMLPDDSFPKYFLGAIDFVWIWFLANLAIGVAVLYKQKTGPVATTFFVIYGMVVLLYASIRSL